MKRYDFTKQEAKILLGALDLSIDQILTSNGEIGVFDTATFEDAVQLANTHASVLADTFETVMETGEQVSLCSKQLSWLLDALAYAKEMVETSSGEIYVFSDDPDEQLAYFAGDYELLCNKLLADNKDVDVDSKATENMEYFRELFLEEALRFAAQNDGFDAYEALDQVLDCDDICNDIHRATRDEIPNIVEFAADHYIW
jgi:hypothetical protein